MSLPPSLLPFSLSSPGSVSLAGLTAHLSEVRAAAELELQYQRAVGHFIYIFAFWREKKKKTDIHYYLPEQLPRA